MRKKKLSIFVMLILAISIMQAEGTVFLFYDSTSENSLTIYDGEPVGIIISDSILENPKRVSIDLFDKSGNFITNILNLNPASKDYSTHHSFGKEVYKDAGGYFIRTTVIDIDGKVETTQLSLEVLGLENTPRYATITSNPIKENNEDLITEKINFNKIGNWVILVSLLSLVVIGLMLLKKINGK